jgi:hypothetical protein
VHIRVEEKNGQPREANASSTLTRGQPRLNGSHFVHWTWQGTDCMAPTDTTGPRSKSSVVDNTKLIRLSLAIAVTSSCKPQKQKMRTIHSTRLWCTCQKLGTVMQQSDWERVAGHRGQGTGYERAAPSTTSPEPQTWKHFTHSTQDRACHARCTTHHAPWTRTGSAGPR